MKVDIMDVIKSAKIFSSLDEVALKKIIDKIEKVYLHKNKILYKQGDVADGLYLVVSGKLVVILQSEKKEKKVLTEITHGETIGELGAVSRLNREVTVQAVEDSILLKVGNDAFAEICNENPSVVLHTMNSLIDRSRSLLHLLSDQKPVKRNVAIISATSQFSLDKFIKIIEEKCKPIEDIVILSAFDADLQNKYQTEADFHQLIDSLENQNKIILYFLSEQVTPLSKICFEKVEMIYVVANGEAKPSIDPAVLKIINNKEFNYIAKKELILLHENEKKLPKNTSSWLKLAEFGLHHHIRLAQDNDIQRILRFMRGRAVGVVLGGGGVRSWAHIGALKALVNAGIPIDAIGGVSAGAIVGGYYALHETYEDTRSQLHKLTEVTRKAVSWRNVTWPAVSIFDGEDYTHQQRKMFGHAQIENLWLPFFCVACNLSKSRQVMHRSGPLWKRVRSSTSVPGIFPPVVIRGQIHVDGGIINNLPVDLMKRMSSNIGTIIAVELVHKDVDETEYHFPPVLTLGKTIIAKYGITKQNYKFPGLIDTFLKSLLMGSSVKQRENAMRADMLITPDLSQFDLLRISKKQESELIEIGHKEAVKAIRKWRRSKREAIT